MFCDVSAAPKITLTNFKAVGANSVVGVTFVAVNPAAGIYPYINTIGCISMHAFST